MLSKSKFLKTAIVAVFVGLAGAAAATPASARDFDRGHHRDGGSGWGRGDHRGGHSDRNWSWRHRHHHHFHGWY
jgi:hypothetical protein